MFLGIQCVVCTFFVKCQRAPGGWLISFSPDHRYMARYSVHTTCTGSDIDPSSLPLPPPLARYPCTCRSVPRLPCDPRFSSVDCASSTGYTRTLAEDLIVGSPNGTKIQGSGPISTSRQVPTGTRGGAVEQISSELWHFACLYQVLLSTCCTLLLHTFKLWDLLRSFLFGTSWIRGTWPGLDDCCVAALDPSPGKVT